MMMLGYTVLSKICSCHHEMRSTKKLFSYCLEVTTLYQLQTLYLILCSEYMMYEVQKPSARKKSQGDCENLIGKLLEVIVMDYSEPLSGRS
jgi:hypothetical protein